MTDSESPAAPQTPEPGKPQEGQEPEQGQEEKPEFVTRDELSQVIAQTKSEIKMADRQRAKQIKDQVSQIEKTLEASGITVSDEQKEKIQTQVAAQYSDTDEGEGTPAPDQPIDAGDIPDQWIDAIDLMGKRGVIIQEGEAEFNEFIKPLLERDDAPGYEITLAVDKAITAKLERTSTQKEKAPLRTPAGGGSGPGEFKAENARQLWTRAHPSK